VSSSKPRGAANGDDILEVVPGVEDAEQPAGDAPLVRLDLNWTARRLSLLIAEASTYSRFSSSLRARNSAASIWALIRSLMSRARGSLRPSGRRGEVQAEGHRCTMLMIVPATKQNDPIRYSQLLMLPLSMFGVLQDKVLDRSLVELEGDGERGEDARLQSAGGRVTSWATRSDGSSLAGAPVVSA
jgi:hypothetical protein